MHTDISLNKYFMDRSIDDLRKIDQKKAKIWRDRMSGCHGVREKSKFIDDVIILHCVMLLFTSHASENVD